MSEKMLSEKIENNFIKNVGQNAVKVVKVAWGRQNTELFSTHKYHYYICYVYYIV